MKKLLFILLLVINLSSIQAAQQAAAQAQLRADFQPQAKEQIMQSIPSMPQELAGMIAQYAYPFDVNEYVAIIDQLGGINNRFVKTFFKLLENLLSNKQGNLDSIGFIMLRSFDPRELMQRLAALQPEAIVQKLSQTRKAGSYTVDDSFEALFYELQALAKIEKDQQVKLLMQKLLNSVNEHKNEIFAYFTRIKNLKSALEAPDLKASSEHTLNNISNEVLSLSKHVNADNAKNIENQLSVLINLLKNSLQESSARSQLDKKEAGEQFEKLKNNFMAYLEPFLNLYKIDSDKYKFGFQVEDILPYANIESQLSQFFKVRMKEPSSIRRR